MGVVSAMFGVKKRLVEVFEEEIDEGFAFGLYDIAPWLDAAFNASPFASPNEFLRGGAMPGALAVDRC